MANKLPKLPLFSMVVAATDSLGIGKDGKIPWRLSGDMAYFKRITSEIKAASAPPNATNAVIMGRNTWTSIPPKFRPLPGRLNIVLSKNAAARSEHAIPEEVWVAGSLESALERLAPHLVSTAAASAVEHLHPPVASIFVIGGGQIYEEGLRLPECDRIYFTSVHKEFDSDVRFPSIDPAQFELLPVSEQDKKAESGVEYEFRVYQRKR